MRRHNLKPIIQDTKCLEQLNTLLKYGPLLIEATLEDCTTINLVHDKPISADQNYAAVVLVRKNGQEVELLGKTPYAEAEAFFNEYLDALAAKGDRVVITYCSFD